MYTTQATILLLSEVAVHLINITITILLLQNTVHTWMFSLQMFKKIKNKPGMCPALQRSRGISKLVSRALIDKYILILGKCAYKLCMCSNVIFIYRC